MKKWPKTRGFLRDGIASGRGVHRKMGVLIQKSRSKLWGKSQKSAKIGILGVGVVQCGSVGEIVGYLWFLRCNCGNIGETHYRQRRRVAQGLWCGGSERPFEQPNACNNSRSFMGDGAYVRSRPIRVGESSNLHYHSITSFVYVGKRRIDLSELPFEVASTSV